MSRLRLLSGPRVGWSPLDLPPVYRPIVWFDTLSPSLITAPGGAVEAWADIVRAYTPTQATEAAKPTLSGDFVVGDGVDDFLSVTTVDAAIPTGANPCWIFCLVDQIGTPVDDALQTIIGYGGNSNNTGRKLSVRTEGGINRAVMSVGTGTAAVVATNPYVELIGRHAILVKITGTTLEIVVDGIGMTPVDVVPGTGTNRFRFLAHHASTPSQFGSCGLMTAAVMPVGNSEIEDRLFAFGTQRFAGA